MKNRILTIFILSSILTVGSGCRKWLDINQNPNVATSVPMNMLLSSAQINTASAVGADLQVNGSLWAQYWTQSPSASQYKIYEQYSPAASDYDREWALLYSGALKDLDEVEKLARASNAKDYLAVALLMKAYTYQVITDAWGDVPFTEALKGDADEGGIINPKYDPQETVYAGINSMIDSARNIIEALDAAGFQSTVAGDLIYNGDLHMWWKFANTLQLKAYLRLIYKSPGIATAGITKVYQHAVDQSGFIGPNENAQITFFSTAGNQNPLFSEMVGLNSTQNLVASQTAISAMAGDPRRQFLYTTVSGTQIGIPQGAYNLPASTPVSIPTARTGARAQDDESATAPVIFISDVESLLLQAEAAARGFTLDAQTLFEDAIYLSFSKYESDIADMEEVLRDDFDTTDTEANDIFMLTADYAAYRYIHGDTLTGFLNGEPVVQEAANPYGVYNNAGLEEQIESIITQKWLSMVGYQGFEAWTEWRRTGYPDFLTFSANSLIGQQRPVRFLYPDVEVTANQSFPGQKFVYEKVWWDVKD